MEAVRKHKKIITKKLPGGKYIHLAKTDGWEKGEVKTKKKKGK